MIKVIKPIEKTVVSNISEISAFLRNFTQKTEKFSDIYYPVESQAVFRLSGSLFGSIPFSTTYIDISYSLVLKTMKDLGFVEIHNDSSFDKDEKNNVVCSQVFASLDFKSVIYIKIGDENNGLDYLMPGDEEKEKEKIVSVYHFYDKSLNENKLDTLSNQFRIAALTECKLKARKNSINFLCYDHCFKLKNVKIKRKGDTNLELNYGPDFLKINDHLMKFLESDETGLAILNGIAGSGKTSFIRHLLSVLSKRVIYIPPHLVNKVAEPDFLSFLLHENDFILVIEDAEEIITNRQDTHNTAGVSNLLNLSDGILGDCIKVKIIATFNAKIDSIDPALLRKGRLKLQYEFGELAPDLANKLLAHLNINHITKEPMSLASIYNFHSTNYRKEEIKKPFGFAQIKE